MPNPYGWGQNEPQIKPKDQGGDTIATFSQKIYNLFDSLFNTLNSYPWSVATQSDAGYMSAADKIALDGVSTTYLPLSGGTMTGNLTLSKQNDFSYIYNANVSYGLGLYGGLDYDQGASIVVFGKTATNNSGFFRVRAHNGSVGKDLIGKPDGTLTWDGKNVATIQTGTWTPVIRGATTAGTYTGTTYGTYYKIGNLVYILGSLGITWSTSPNGQARLTGLPYTVKNANTGIYFAGTGTSPGATRISDAVCISGQSYAVARARNLSGSTADVSSFASSESGYNIVGEVGKTMNLTITGCYLTD